MREARILLICGQRLIPCACAQLGAESLRWTVSATFATAAGGRMLDLASGMLAVPGMGSQPGGLNEALENCRILLTGRSRGAEGLVAAMWQRRSPDCEPPQKPPIRRFLLRMGADGTQTASLHRHPLPARGLKDAPRP